MKRSSSYWRRGSTTWFTDLAWLTPAVLLASSYRMAHVLVNGRTVNIASYNVKVGDEITIKDNRNLVS